MVDIPAELPVSIIFALTPEFADRVPVARPALTITPAPIHYWNNFGHNFDVLARLLLADGTVKSLNLELMFADGGRTSSRISSLLQDSPGWREGQAIGMPFCSLLHTANDYGDLVQQIGFELAVSALRVAGDAVITKIEDRDKTRLALIASDPFLVSMLRRNEAYTALRRGSRYLRRTPAPEVADAAVSFVMGVRLPSASNRYLIDFDFDFDPLGRNRISVLIGRNGTGKSQLLLSLIDGLREVSTMPLSARYSPVHFRRRERGKPRSGAPHVSRIIVFSSTPSDTYPPDLPPWHGVDYAFFHMTARRDSGADALTRSLVDCLRDDGRNTFPVPPDPNDLEGETGRLGLLERVLTPLRMWQRLYLPLSSGDDLNISASLVVEQKTFIPMSKYTGWNEQRRLMAAGRIDINAQPLILGEDMQPRQLSSGETAMLRFAAQAVASVENGSLFVFDEPETHLHPNFISDFTEILHLLLTATKSVAIIATHSAYLVRETPSRRVRVLNFDEDGQIQISRPRMQTFGSSIDSISDAVFFDSNRIHRYQQTLRNWLTEQGSITVEEVLSRHGSDMNPETLSYIAHLIRQDTDI